MLWRRLGVASGEGGGKTFLAHIVLQVPGDILKRPNERADKPDSELRGEAKAHGDLLMGHPISYSRRAK